jgi:hypothetical protein
MYFVVSLSIVLQNKCNYICIGVQKGVLTGNYSLKASKVKHYLSKIIGNAID